jgi:hypothetical protein
VADFLFTGAGGLAPCVALDGSSAIRAFLEKTWAAYPELYHWVANLSLTVPGDSTMRGEGRITALCVKPSGTTIREVGTLVLDYTKTARTWLISRQAVTIQRRELQAWRGVRVEVPAAACGRGSRK